MGGGVGNGPITLRKRWQDLPAMLKTVYDLEQQARDIVLCHQRYREMSPAELGARLDIPLHLARAAVVEDRMFFSWMRPTKGLVLERQLNGEMPQYDDWTAKGPLLWIVDLAALPGTTGTWVGRALSRMLAEFGAAEIGERVAFRRHSGARFGWATVRG